MEKWILSALIAVILSNQVVHCSKPFEIGPPKSHNGHRNGTDKGPKYLPSDDVTIDQLIRKVMENHPAPHNMVMGSDAPLSSPSELYYASGKPSSERGYMLAEMDMVLTKSQADSLYKAKSPHKRNKRKIYKASKPWPGGVVPYTINPWDFTGTERTVLNLAMREWEQYTCLKFRPSTASDVDKIIIRNGVGCNSELGTVGGAQVVNLEAPGCRYKGLYLHELGHALGLVHEHQLPERDNYIEILWNNVNPAWRQWFDKYQTSEFDRQEGIGYDLASVMHYGITAFSKDGVSQTIRAKDRSKDKIVGKVYKKELSFMDIKVINSIYQCSSHCPSNIRCSNGGFVDKNCECFCPDGTNSCQTYPRITPRRPVTCQNKHSTAECDKWADEGQCTLNPIWMIDNCKSSCKKCDKIEEATLPLKICSNSYNDTDCDVYARSGECTDNPAWMLQNCKASCGWCSSSTTECKDLYPDASQCLSWKNEGQCDKNPGWMFANCRKTCGICPNTPDNCANKAGDAKCYADASVGECSANPEYMIENCALACGKCGSCFNKFTDDAACVELAAQGECILSPEWMSKYCRKACDTCEKEIVPGVVQPCRDIDSNCANWASQGECDVNPSWMIPNCQRSCNKCSCVNKDGDSQCDGWAQRGECEANPIYMAQNCQKSCRYCTNLPIPSDRCSNKHTEPEKCDGWASQGECIKNPLFMIPKCRKSCTECDKATVCTRWSDWSSWTGCSRTCGTGMRSRTRRCMQGTLRTEEEMSACQTIECPTTTINPRVTTTPTPVVTTTGPETCVNKHHRDSDCEAWSMSGHCDKNPGWMHVYCAKSCGICSSGCINKYGDDNLCEQWASNNQCSENPLFMLPNCAKACGNCGSILPTTTSSPITTTQGSSACANTHSSDRDCDIWAQTGHCSLNPSYMLRHCARSCNSCSSVTSTTTTTRSPPIIKTTTAPPPTVTATIVMPPIPNCIDEHTSCSAWARSNYCSSSQYVKRYCKYSCSLCDNKEGTDSTDECYDRSSRCRAWAAEGRCVTHRQMMKQECPFSCEYCLPIHCIDVDTNCLRWARTQACHIFPKLMAQKCRLSCGYCSHEHAFSTVASQP